MVLSATVARAVDLADGHTDFINVVADEKGNLVLTVKEDITGHNVLRQPEDVQLVVREEAKTSLEGPFSTFGETGWLLPLTQKPGLLWPGFDTLGVQSAGFGAIDIVFDRVEGPGSIYLATQADGFSTGLVPLLKDGFQVRSGSVRHQANPAHVHAYWLFTEPGTYTMEVHATGGGKTSNTGTYTWIVEGNGDGSGTGSGTGTDPSSEAAAPTATAGTDTDGGKKDSATASSTTTATPSKPYFNPLDDPWLNTPVRRDEPTAKRPAGAASGSSGFGSSGSGYTASDPAPAGDRTPRRSQADTPGAAVDDTPRAGTAAGQCTLVEHTVSGQVLTPVIRDDRTAPARMVDPESLVFHLGPKATATTTVPVGAIAAGTEVHMIGATQVDEVPWLGANTMNDDLLAATTGEVTWRLTGFTGPGRMEVFTSGNFGQVVGDRWFSAAPGRPSGQVVIARNTHVHPNWIFDTPGTYTVTITQTARTHSGTVLEKPTTLTFTVGEGDGVNSGHFDLGATVTTATNTDASYVDAAGQPCDPQTGTRVAETGGAADDTTAGPAAAASTATEPGRRGGAVMANTGIDPLVAAVLFVAVACLSLGLALMGGSRVRDL
nr:TIGR03773 family transporter-associated surface protein [Corynebacterium mendelii]